MVSTFIAFFNQIMYLVNYSKLKIAAPPLRFQLSDALQVLELSIDQRIWWEDLQAAVNWLCCLPREE